MKKFISLAIFITAGVFWQSFTTSTTDETSELKWYTWEEAVAANEKNPKPIFIDLYTDWCGWCKRMDATTFSDPKIENYLMDNFYPVKFDAEQKETLEFQGHSFSFVNSGRRGYHEFAHSLLDGRMGYPTTVILNASYERIMISPGYKPAKDLMKELEYAQGGHYKDLTFEEFKAQKP